MLDRAVLSVLGLFTGVLASTMTPARGQDDGKPYFHNAGWTVESLIIDGRPIGCIARTRSTDDGTFAISAVGEREWKDDKFNISLRKFLKQVGVTSQQEIERVVREKSLSGKGTLKVKMVLTAEGTGLNHTVEGQIDLS